MRRIKRSTFIPILLLIYLAAMAAWGYPGFASGKTSDLQYFGTIAVTIGIIVLLHFSLKKRDRLRNQK